MSESSFEDSDLTAGATVEGEDQTVDSATADRAAGYDDPATSAEGTVTDDDAVVADPPE